LRAHLRPLPALARAPPPAGRHAVGRRAADARRVTRAHAATAPVAARRAVVRPRAAHRAGAVRHPRRDQPRRGYEHAAGGAERLARAGAGRAGLPDGDRPRGDVGHRRRRQAQRGRAPLLSRLLTMDVLLHQVFSGLATGGIYASVALALVMIYQATHLVNFAQGEMAMFSTYIAWSLVNAGMGYWPAFLLTVLIAFVLGVLIERVVIRPVENAPVLAVVVVFIGLLVILNSVAGWI